MAKRSRKSKPTPTPHTPAETAAARARLVARGRAQGWTIETGGETWFARGRTPEAALVAAFKAREPKSPTVLTRAYPTGERPTQANLLYAYTLGFLKTCGYKVTDA